MGRNGRHLSIPANSRRARWIERLEPQPQAVETPIRLRLCALLGRSLGPQALDPLDDLGVAALDTLLVDEDVSVGATRRTVEGHYYRQKSVSQLTDRRSYLIKQHL